MALVTRNKQAITVTDAGLVIIEKMATEGNADATISRALGIGVSAFRKALVDDERVDGAYQIGRGKLADTLTDLLLTAAKDGNITAAIFLSKARCGWRDVGPATPGTVATQVNIHIPAPMSDAAFKKMITVESKNVD